MKILEYDDVDPVSVFHLERLSLGFSLTPELAAHIRRDDPRPFPCLAVCAVEDGRVVGLVGVFRLPMATSEGIEDLGGVWAVATHPEYAGRGIASRLLEEAHARMRAAGLRFSTLGTSRTRNAYRLYLRHGYEDTFVFATGFADWETAHQPTRLRAQPAGPAGHDEVERIFAAVARDYLGFTQRHVPFAHLRDRVSLDDIYILSENDRQVGYALARVDRSLLTINDLLLRPVVDATEAVAAVASRLKAAHVQVAVSRPAVIASLRRAGYHVAHPDWEAFMIKPLAPGVTVADARRLLGIGTDRFLISWLDTT